MAAFSSSGERNRGAVSCLTDGSLTCVDILRKGQTLTDWSRRLRQRQKQEEGGEEKDEKCRGYEKAEEQKAEEEEKKEEEDLREERRKRRSNRSRMVKITRRSLRERDEEAKEVELREAG